MFGRVLNTPFSYSKEKWKFYDELTFLKEVFETKTKNFLDLRYGPSFQAITADKLLLQ